MASDSENQKKSTRHTGILQDQLRRSAKPPWCPSLSVAFRILLLIRFCAATYSNITDCDEVYNFWEPLHYLDQGTGFQTWELSPAYAIRSWAYILLHLAPLKVVAFLLGDDKRTAFFALRAIFSVISSYCEAKLYRSVAEHVHLRVGRYMLFMLMFSAGLWNASTAFLPSTFAMYTTSLAYSYAFELPSKSRSARTLYATVLFALGALVGWPFAIALAIPFVLEELFLPGMDIVSPQAKFSWAADRLIRLIRSGLLASTILIPVIAIDSMAYGRFSLVPWNIVRYNVFGGSERGPDLYGISPWHFYLVNLALNFNLVAIAALLSGPALLFTYYIDAKRLGPKPKAGFQGMAVRLAPIYVWLAILTLQPHKEERFLFPAYPLICFNAAVTLYLARGWLEVWYLKVTKSPYKASQSALFSRFTLIVVIITSAISISRIFAVTRYYHAPIAVAARFGRVELPRLLNATGLLPPRPPRRATAKYDEGPRIDLGPVRQFNLTICLGKEWYRFPSHYFVPNGVAVQFIKSDFSGLLPTKFLPSEGTSLLEKTHKTRLVPEGLNDINREVLSHYVGIASCDYLIDSDAGATPALSSHERPFVRDTKNWDQVACSRFLDSGRTPMLYRVLWVPGDWWQSHIKWAEYCLLRNKRRAKEREGKKWAFVKA